MSSPISLSDRTQLRAAINRTLAARSVRIDVVWPGNDGSIRSMILNRPDRIRTETLLPDGVSLASISIGRDSYESTTSPGRWIHTRVAKVPVGTFEATLQPWLPADGFRVRDGAVYVGEVSSRGVRFKVRARLDGGYVVEVGVVSIPGQVKRVRPFNASLRLSQFGVATGVVAPGATQVDEVQRATS